MKPLSTVKFIKGSMGKVLPLAITAALAVGLLYFASILVNHLAADKYEINVSWLSNMSVVSDGDPTMNMRKGSGIAAEDEAALRACGYVKDLFAANLWSVDYKTITDSSSLYIVMLHSRDVAAAMQWQKLKLAEGALPANPYEIVLQRKLAANLGLKVGSIVKKDTAGWRIGADVKVVGIADGPALMGLGAGHEGCLKDGAPGVGLVAFTGGESVGRMNGFIQRDLSRKYNTLTLGLAKPSVDKIAQAFNLVSIFIGVIIVSALSVLLGNITLMQYTQRIKEFELMNAVGFTRKHITVKVLKELGVSNILGYMAGIGLAVLAGWLMNVYLLGDKFQEMTLINGAGMAWMLLVPLFITAFGMIAPLKMIRFKDIM